MLESDITIKPIENGFDVHYGGRSTEELTYGEMLEVVSRLALGVAPNQGWLKTAEEHRQFLESLTPCDPYVETKAQHFKTPCDSTEQAARPREDVMVDSKDSPKIFVVFDPSELFKIVFRANKDIVIDAVASRYLSGKVLAGRRGESKLANVVLVVT